MEIKDSKIKLFTILFFAVVFMALSFVIFQGTLASNNNNGNYYKKCLPQTYICDGHFNGCTSFDTAYCISELSCVYNHQCYEAHYDAGAAKYHLKTSGNDQWAMCGECYHSGNYEPYWIDCDKDPSSCGTTICHGGSVKAGESGVGEYTDTSTAECCGDDANEYYITNFCSGYSGPAKCCNNANDKIDANGNCVSSCSLRKARNRITFPYHRFKFYWFLR